MKHKNTSPFKMNIKQGNIRILFRKDYIRLIKHGNNGFTEQCIKRA